MIYRDCAVNDIWALSYAEPLITPLKERKSIWALPISIRELIYGYTESKNIFISATDFKSHRSITELSLAECLRIDNDLAISVRDYPQLLSVVRTRDMRHILIDLILRSLGIVYNELYTQNIDIFTILAENASSVKYKETAFTISLSRFIGFFNRMDIFCPLNVIGGYAMLCKHKAAKVALSVFLMPALRYCKLDMFLMIIGQRISSQIFTSMILHGNYQLFTAYAPYLGNTKCKCVTFMGNNCLHIKISDFSNVANATEFANAVMRNDVKYMQAIPKTSRWLYRLILACVNINDIDKFTMMITTYTIPKPIYAMIISHLEKHKNGAEFLRVASLLFCNTNKIECILDA